MQALFQVTAHEREEARNCKSFPAIAQDVVVDCFCVVDVGEKGDNGVDGDHEEDADDVSLFLGKGVVSTVLEDEVAGNKASGEAGAGAYHEADLVKGVAAIDKVGYFLDYEMKSADRYRGLEWA